MQAIDEDLQLNKYILNLITDIKKIYIIKNRPFHNPLIIHVASLEEAKMIGKLNNTAMKMAKAF